MEQKPHILICGDRGAGKSTLIERLLDGIPLPRFGFVTKRLTPDSSGFHPIYIHPASDMQRVQTETNRIGICNGRTHLPATEIFDTLGVQYLNAPAQNGIIVMDELGFLEAEATRFTAAVLAALDGDIPVIAAVKNRTDVPFLNAVLQKPKAEVYRITPQNRDALYDLLRPRMEALR